jgi:hypothetical protein
MMATYVKISRPNIGGSYIQPLDQLANAIDAEFDGVKEWAEPGEIISFEFIEMDDEAYKLLPEFDGW